MANEMTDPTEETIVRRVLEADGLDAERALGVLLRTLAEDFRKAREASGGAIVMGRPTALELLMHALGVQIQRSRKEAEENGDDGVAAGGTADVQGSLHE